MLAEGTDSLNLNMAYSSDNTLHVLQLGGTQLHVNKFSVEQLPTATSLQSQLQLEFSSTPTDLGGDSRISVYKRDDGQALISVCAQYMIGEEEEEQTSQIDIFSTLTASDSTVVSEARLTTSSSFFACEAINSASSTLTYAVLRKSESEGLALLTL